MSALKVTKSNHLPGTGDERFKVFSKQFNELVDYVNDTVGTPGTLEADTISEETAAAGVTVDGVLIKDGGITLASGAGIALSPTVTQYTADVAISSANLLAMYATPVDVVTAPSSSYALDFVSAVLINDDATDYASGGTITINYGSGGAAVSTTLASTFLTANGDKVWNLQKLNAAGGYTMPVGTSLAITNASGAFTTGTGVCRLKITYNKILTGL
jgi:hypothetical protein